uniref:FBA domain-containing protein n=1 Tax=Clastoptera arizonana TaxID=38151 RepID=A0A1B6DUW5_9HEMI
MIFYFYRTSLYNACNKNFVTIVFVLQIKHVFSNYGIGVRYIMFVHSGVDTQYWNGHYGSKMSGGRVYLEFPQMFPSQEQSEDEGDEDEDESGPDLGGDRLVRPRQQFSDIPRHLW